MRVLITGAAGVLGKALTALLEQESNIDMRLTDMIPLDASHEFVQADLSKRDEALPLCADVDEVVHIASIHPWKQYTAEQYIDCNIKSTHNILEAAANSDVRRVIYTSSIAAMGMSPTDAVPLPWDESKPCVPDGNIYAVTKHVGEQFCEMFRLKGQFSYVALRPGTFIPQAEDDPKFGLGLLSSWVHSSDVAMAHLLALKSSVQNEAIIITAKVPFTMDDGPALLTDAPPVILKYYPRARDLAAKGIQLPREIHRCYNIQKAERLLGFQPRYTFERWLDKVLGK